MPVAVVTTGLDYYGIAEQEARQSLWKFLGSLSWTILVLTNRRMSGKQSSSKKKNPEITSEIPFFKEKEGLIGTKTP